MTNQCHISVDVESNGPCPHFYSIISVGAIVVAPDLAAQDQFYGEGYDDREAFTGLEGAYEASKIKREIHVQFQPMPSLFKTFGYWVDHVADGRRATLWSDNPAFDWQWINYGFQAAGMNNPFGFSARRIGDFYAGSKHDITKATEWKKLRITRHTHNALDDARGNAEAMLQIMPQLSRNI